MLAAKFVFQFRLFEFSAFIMKRSSVHLLPEKFYYNATLILFNKIRSF